MNGGHKIKCAVQKNEPHTFYFHIANKQKPPESHIIRSRMNKSPTRGNNTDIKILL